jgi:6-phosphogluconolactonase
MRIRPCLISNLALLFVVLLATLAIASAAKQDGNYILYVGTYTEKGSKGIYAYRYDAHTGQITPLGLAAEVDDASWMTLHPNRRLLYAVNNSGAPKDPNRGVVSAFAIDRSTGRLTLLNEVPSRGGDPCYVTVDKTGKYVLVANYGGGSVAVFPILPDGKLGEATAFQQHTGHGANPERQEGPHVHSVDLSPDNRFALVDDLGLDEIRVYKFDSRRGTLRANDPPFAKIEAGAGPRHLVLHPSGKFAYVVAEMHSEVAVFSYDDAGGLHALQTISTLPNNFSGVNNDAEIQVHPSGKFLYASNRGHDSIAVYTINPSKGTLTLVEITPTLGKEPRNFEIDPTGNLLFAANQKSDNIVGFRIDQKTGRLNPTGEVLQVATPVCLKFLSVQ